MPESMELSSEQCSSLLCASTAGRVAVSTPSGPHIVPVNYSVVDNEILIRTSPYSVLGTYGRDSLLAFEIDQFDYAHERGWSVVVRGKATMISEPEEIARIRSVWPPQPWASGSRNLHLRIPWTEISGRRLGLGWDITKGLAS
ncbi:MAG: pyridoxamine 5'-phosphate oxidase family protein [Nocardioidaceae bacterium]